MTKTATVTFDGRVLNPSSPLDLEADRTYRITIHGEEESSESTNAWECLESAAGSIDAPEDWASEHDHYLYGTPKRSKDE